MKIKKLLLILIVSFLPAIAAASGFSGFVSYNFTLPERSNIVFCDARWNVLTKENFELGPFAGVGYSVRHYTTGGSNALVYGPAVEAGILAGYRKGCNAFKVSGGAQVVYAQFPTILWGKVGLEYGYSFKPKTDLIAHFGLLFGRSGLSYEAGIGLCLRFE